MPRPLILDVDTGVDDLIALLLAVASPELELLAATTVFGNVDIDRTVRNTALSLDLTGRQDVEVSRGAGAPLEGSWTPFPIVHGEEGLRDMCEVRHVNYDRLAMARDPIWYPYSERAYNAALKGLRLLFRRGSPVKKILDLL